MSLTGKVWAPLFTPEQRKAFLAQLIDDAVAKAIRAGGSHA